MTALPNTEQTAMPSVLPKTLRIATRRSALALWQAEYVKSRLQILYPEMAVELVALVSRGDKILDVPLAKVGGKGLFVKELEHALLNKQADIAVHSMKDVPMTFPAGLGLAVVCEREDPRDAFVSSRFSDLQALPSGSVVGTSSLRRQCQLLEQRPDLEIRFLRGNVNTRLSRLDGNQYDAIILAAAGLIRLGMANRIRDFIAPEISLPAGGQGAVGIECRIDDKSTMALLQPLHHEKTSQQITAERAMNRRLDGGCQVPIGCYALHQGDQLWLRGLVGNPNGSKIISDEIRGAPDAGEELGVTLAERLLQAGAGEILAQVYNV